MEPNKRDDLKLPMTFVCFALLKGSLYRFPHTALNVTHKKPFGNSVVYGAVYIVHDAFFHIRTLDAYHLCTKDALGENHKFDHAHRVSGKVSPIMFKNLQELDRLIYVEDAPIDVQYYVANPKHPTTAERVRRRNGANYRIYHGIVPHAFQQQLEGIQNEKRNRRKSKKLFTKLG